MASRDEQADILGGPILQRPESGVFSEYHFVFKSATLLAVGLLVWIACARGLERLKRHRELRYRKAMRRKHGIPDSDCRPFAVAYAAAKRAHLEREAQDQRKTGYYVSDHDSRAVDQRTNAQKDACLLRKRVPETAVQLHDYQLPSKHATVKDNKRPEVHALDFADRYNPIPLHRMAIPDPLPVENSSIRHKSRNRPVVNLDNGESRKRSLEDGSAIEHGTVKKSRINCSDLVNGCGQADWYAQYSNRTSRRASKEPLDRQPEGNGVINGQERCEHVDDLRNEDHEHDEAMEGIVEGEVTGSRAVARGKKRDRAEAGSTFGGDDEEDIRNGRASHHRKRRTIFRGVEPPTRGQKRDREAESPESEGEGVDSETPARRAQRTSKKKRSKKVVPDEASEISVEDPCISKDPLCGGRRVGDNWEIDGVQYRVGNKGERLRLTLVKKARNKYHMPQDSQHPDRSAALEIYVEMWMTEEQYKQAESRQELAWQEASMESSGSKTPDVDFSTKHGKDLLWDSVKSSPARRSFRHFIPPSAPARINPFEQWQLQPISGRRVASSSTVISPALPRVTDGPTRPGLRGFSKWEKQDREAEAMASIRAKIEEQKKAQVLPQISTSVTAPELATTSLSVPTITLTPAPVEAAAAKLDDSTPQSNSKFSFATPSGTKDTTATGITSTPIPTAISTVSPFAPAATSSPHSLSSSSFVKSPQMPSSTSPATTSSVMPSLFGKGIDASTPPLSDPAPTMGVTTQHHPPTTEGFSKPGVSSSSPGVVAPLINKTHEPLFNVPSGSSLSPFNFGSPVATKGDAPVHLSNSTTTSESSKPTAPLFSFSGTPSSSLATMLPTPTASSAPKFSFGQPSTTSTFVPGSNLLPGPVSQPKSTFKFGQSSPGPKDGTPAVPIPDESKKAAVQVPTLGGPSARPSQFETTAGFGTSAFGFPSASGTNLFGKPGSVDNGFSASVPPRPILAPAGPTAVDSTSSSTPARVPTSNNAPVFSFSGTNPGAKPAEGSKPASLPGGVAEGSNSMVTFGANSAERKPTFKFGASDASTDGHKSSPMSGGRIESLHPPSIPGNAVEGPKPTFAFGGPAETPRPMFGGTVESKSTSTFGPVPESSNPFINTGSTPIQGSVLPSVSPFTLGKDGGVATNTSTPTNPQTKPSTSVFGVPVGTTGSKFGQPSTFATSGDPTQSIFGKPTNATPSAFGFSGTGASSTFTFSKPAAQSQQQEQ